MQDSDELVAIDLATQTLKWRVKTGSLPADVYGSPDDKTLFIGLTGGEGVEVFDIAGGKQARLVKTIPPARARTPSAARATGATSGEQPRGQHHQQDRHADPDRGGRAAGPTGPDCMDVSADGR
jgi:DNA-binding beta-propeller fold protein YncE